MSKQSQTLVERVRRLTVVALFSDDELMEMLVLKGGNLLDMLYQASVRASVDIDLSMEGDFPSLEFIEKKLEKVLPQTFLEQEFHVFDIVVELRPPEVSEDMKDIWGGYRIYFKIIEVHEYEKYRDEIEKLRRNALSIGERGSTRFRIDVSKFEYCEHRVAHQIDGLTIYGYSPQLFVAEKIRAICQQIPSYAKQMKTHRRPRARDFVDIYLVIERFKLELNTLGFRDVIEKVFDSKRVSLNLLNEVCNYREFHQLDFPSVQDTAKPGVELESFSYYFDYLLQKIKDL